MTREEVMIKAFKETREFVDLVRGQVISLLSDYNHSNMMESYFNGKSAAYDDIERYLNTRIREIMYMKEIEDGEEEND